MREPTDRDARRARSARTLKQVTKAGRPYGATVESGGGHPRMYRGDDSIPLSHRSGDLSPGMLKAFLTLIGLCLPFICTIITLLDVAKEI